MPNPLFKLIGDTIGSVVKPVTGLVDEIFTSDEERQEFKTRLAEIASTAENAAMAHAETIANAQRDVIVAELQQDDKYTKRARPTIAYSGIAVLILNHIILPWAAFFSGTDASGLPSVELPAEFWWGWTGVVGVWAIGRSVEKKAKIQGEGPGKYTRMITGS